MSVANFKMLTAGHYALVGALTFETITTLLNEVHALAVFTQAAEINVDLSGVTHSDSAGLALLIELRRLAQQHTKKITFNNIPKQLHALASISEVENLLVA